jgi:hypothetical protein
MGNFWIVDSGKGIVQFLGLVEDEVFGLRHLEITAGGMMVGWYGVMVFI